MSERPFHGIDPAMPELATVRAARRLDLTRLKAEGTVKEMMDKAREHAVTFEVDLEEPGGGKKPGSEVRRKVAEAAPPNTLALPWAIRAQLRDPELLARDSGGRCDFCEICLNAWPEWVWLCEYEDPPPNDWVGVLSSVEWLWACCSACLAIVMTGDHDRLVERSLFQVDPEDVDEAKSILVPFHVEMFKAARQLMPARLYHRPPTRD